MSAIVSDRPKITRLTSADNEPERDPDCLIPGDINDVAEACLRDSVLMPVPAGYQWEFIASPDDGVWSVWYQLIPEGGAQ